MTSEKKTKTKIKVNNNNVNFSNVVDCLSAIYKLISCIGIFILTVLALVLYLPICWYQPFDIIGCKLNDICEWALEI